MKTVKRLLYDVQFLSVAVLVILFSIVFHTNNELGKPKKAKKKPGNMKSMDLWTDMRTYPSGKMDPTAFTESFEQGLRMSISESIGIYGASSTSPWTELGPKNFAGRILCAAFHPTNPNIMYVGAASGGLWKTTNGGNGAADGINWQYVPTGFPVLGVSSIVINPLNPNEIYIGTGEVYSSSYAATGPTGAGHIRTFRGSYGIGILKTTDGGASWTKTLNFPDANIKGVMDMVIHPTTPDTVFAATTDGLYRTRDGGTNWNLVHSVVLTMDLCYKPGDPNVLYVGSGNFQSAGTGIYKSTNANATTPTFTQLTSANFPSPISGKIQIAISPNNTSRIYASIGRDPNTSHTQGLYVSTNEGSTWAASGAATILANQGWYAHDVAVSTTDANRVYWGELNTWRSTNGGASFSQVGWWSNWNVLDTIVGTLQEGVNQDYVHADVHRMYVSPHDASGSTLFLCTDGGLFRTTDGGTNFQTLNGGLNTAQIYSNISIHPTNPNYMLCGLQDNEAMVYEGYRGCERIGSLGDGFHSAINYNGNIQLVESYYFNRRRSTDGGVSWGAGSGAVAEVACFNVPMVFSQAASSGYMYAGTVLFKRSTNSGSTWSNLNGGSPISGSNNPCIAMAAPTDNLVYFSTAPASGIRSKMWKTTNGAGVTPTFTEITGTLPDRYYSKITVDPANSNRLAVTLSGFGGSHLFLSADAGASWCDIGAGLPNVPHNTVLFDPNNSATIYVGNDVGVFYANNVPTGALGSSASLTWLAYNEGFDDAIMVSDLAVTSTDKLRIATYGRGLWERDMAPTSALPVVFNRFTVVPGDNGNQLQWTIATQSNVQRYVIEYSNDASHFNVIGSIPAKIGAAALTYSYVHGIRNERNGYYRIKIIDIDETFTYSTIEAVKGQKLTGKLTAYPNPTSGLFKIKLPTDVNEAANVMVYNSAGMLVMMKKLVLYPGTHESSIDISRLRAGNYQVVCEGATTNWSTRVIKR